MYLICTLFVEFSQSSKASSSYSWTARCSATSMGRLTQRLSIANQALPLPSNGLLSAAAVFIRTERLIDTKARFGEKKIMQELI